MNPIREEKDLLAGNVCAEGRTLDNGAGVSGFYFIFAEMSVRREGKFRILFTLVNPLQYSLILH